MQRAPKLGRAPAAAGRAARMQAHVHPCAVCFAAALLLGCAHRAAAVPQTAAGTTGSGASTGTDATGHGGHGGHGGSASGASSGSADAAGHGATTMHNGNGWKVSDAVLSPARAHTLTLRLRPRDGAFTQMTARCTLGGAGPGIVRAGSVQAIDLPAPLKASRRPIVDHSSQSSPNRQPRINRHARWQARFWRRPSGRSRTRRTLATASTSMTRRSPRWSRRTPRPSGRVPATVEREIVYLAALTPVLAYRTHTQ